MSMSLLYRGFGIRDSRHASTKPEGGKVVFTVRQHTAELRCTSCGSRCMVRRGSKTRRLRKLPIGSRQVQGVLAVASSINP